MESPCPILRKLTFTDRLSMDWLQIEPILKTPLSYEDGGYHFAFKWNLKDYSKWTVLSGQLVWQTGTQITGILLMDRLYICIPIDMTHPDRSAVEIQYREVYGCIHDRMRCPTKTRNTEGQCAILSLAGSQNLCQTIIAPSYIASWCGNLRRPGDYIHRHIPCMRLALLKSDETMVDWHTAKKRLIKEV